MANNEMPHAPAKTHVISLREQKCHDNLFAIEPRCRLLRAARLIAHRAYRADDLKRRGASTGEQASAGGVFLLAS